MSAPEPTPEPAPPHYQEPGWFTRNVFNRAVAGMTRMGVSVWGSRELRVRGRTSGEWRTTPVNLLTLDGAQYLVAARGHTQRVRNLRVYLKKWKAEVGVFFDGVGGDSPDADLQRIAPDHPVFKLDG